MLTELFLYVIYSFITYRSCKHLDNKHTVFGRLVGGMDTLNSMERVEVDNKDRPIEDIIIERASVFVDPFTEVDEEVITGQLHTVHTLIVT